MSSRISCIILCSIHTFSSSLISLSIKVPVLGAEKRHRAKDASLTMCLDWLMLRSDILSKAVARALRIMGMSSLSVMLSGT